jgi:hypothetical protein
VEVGAPPKDARINSDVVDDRGGRDRAGRTCGAEGEIGWVGDAQGSECGGDMRELKEKDLGGERAGG